MHSALYIKKYKKRKQLRNKNLRSPVFTWYAFLGLTKKKGEG